MSKLYKLDYYMVPDMSIFCQKEIPLQGKDHVSISSTDFYAAFTCANAMAVLNYYFIHMLYNFIHYSERKVRPTFMVYAVCQKDKYKSTSAKAAHKFFSEAVLLFTLSPINSFSQPISHNCARRQQRPCRHKSGECGDMNNSVGQRCFR